MAAHLIIETLRELRRYALDRGAVAAIHWNAEDSHMVRYANSAISLNSHEDLVRMRVSVYDGRREATTGLIVDPADVDAMKRAIDQAIDMVPFASEKTYEPTIATIPETVVYEDSYDPEVVELSNEEIIAFVNDAVAGLETEDILLSGNFSAGVVEQAVIWTTSDNVVCRRSTDIGITLVLASEKRKWEINAEQFVWRKADLDAQALHDRLRWLSTCYTTCPEERAEERPYRVIMGPAAIAEYLMYLEWLGTTGGSMKRGFSMLKDDSVGQKIMSERFTLVEDPSLLDTFPMPVDLYGRRRDARAVYDRGVFTGFIWDQASADEFGASPTASDVPNLSFKLMGGDAEWASIQALAEEPRDEDLLYIPYLHYGGIVNPSEGLITGSSRFGALLLKKDGSIALPYNVRFTEKLSDLFGKKLVWLAKETMPYGSSSHYGGRDPYSTIVPVLGCFDDINVEISNKSF